MPTETSMDVYVSRLDVMCEVLRNDLANGKHVTKATMKGFIAVAQKVIDEHGKQC